MSSLSFLPFACIFDWTWTVPELFEYPLQIFLVLRGIERALGRLFSLNLHSAVVTMKMEGASIGLSLSSLLRKYPILSISEVILEDRQVLVA